MKKKNTPEGEAFLERMRVKKEAREKARLTLAKTPEELLQTTKLLVPWEAMSKDLRHDLSPDAKLQLVEALLHYCRNNQSCIHPDQFITDCTELPISFLKDSIEGFDASKMDEKEQRVIKNACRLLSRARGICEQNIAVYHTKTNPQFAQFYMKNRYGYIDRTEQKTEQSGSISINLTIPMPNPPPKKLEDSTK